MKVVNPTDRDVVVSAAPPGSTLAAFMLYVRAGQDTTFTGVPNGTYNISISSGEDWDGDARTFTRRCGYHTIPETLAYMSTATTYRKWTITVPPISPGDNLADAGTFPT